MSGSAIETNSLEVTPHFPSSKIYNVFHTENQKSIEISSSSQDPHSFWCLLHLQAFGTTSTQRLPHRGGLLGNATCNQFFEWFGTLKFHLKFITFPISLNDRFVVLGRSFEFWFDTPQNPGCKMIMAILFFVTKITGSPFLSNGFRHQMATELCKSPGSSFSNTCDCMKSIALMGFLPLANTYDLRTQIWVW